MGKIKTCEYCGNKFNDTYMDRHYVKCAKNPHITEQLRRFVLDADGFSMAKTEYQQTKPKELPCVKSIRAAYGGWSAFVEAIGGKVKVYDYYFDDELLERIKSVVYDNGRGLTTAEYDNARPENLPTSSYIKRKFGKWNNLLNHFGLKANYVADANVYVGKKIGHLFIQSVAMNGNRMYATCLCDCGKVKNIRLSSIVSGKIKACGHLQGKKVS